MGRRSGVAETEEEVSKLGLDGLNMEIERCRQGAEHGGTSQGRKAIFKRLVWLEKMRQRIHGIPAARRLWRRREEHGDT
jgi:hypothetical protein